jgi:hypothetical protein
VWVELANPSDEPALRSLLRAGIMEGQVRLALEREPDFFQAAITEGSRHQTIVGRRAAGGQVQAMGSRSVRRRFVNGRPCLVPYLGAFRTGSDWTGSLASIRRGYELCRTLQKPDETRFSITSIMADNTRARRLLERGLPGLPRYQPLGRQVTLALPVGRVRRLPTGIRRGTAADMAEICALLQDQGRSSQFHPVWDESELYRLSSGSNLTPEDFLLYRIDGRLTGCAAVWDQRPLRQTVIHGYGRALSLVRPVVNAAATLAGRATLPDTGSVLASGFISHLAVVNSERTVLHSLLAGACWLARSKGLAWLAAGFGDNHPLLAPMSRSRPCRRLLNILYLVYWPNDEQALPTDAGTTPLALDVATL